MFDMEKIGAYIAAKRRDCGLTQGQFAEKLNVTHQAVSKWERGEAMPEISKITEIAKVLGVSVDEILVQMQDKPQNNNSLENEEQDYTDADKKYLELGFSPSISDVYELASGMSPAVLANAVQRLIRDNGYFAVSLFLPMLDKKTANEISEKIYWENGMSGIQFLGKYLPQDFIDKMILREYGRNNPEAVKLLPYTKNEKIINAVFDAEVARVGTWNSLVDVVAHLPPSVIVHQGVKYARKYDLSTFSCWWGRFGRDTSAMLMAAYAKECGYTQDAWRQVARFSGYANTDILEKAINESIELHGRESVEPLLNKSKQSGWSGNFNQNIQDIVNKAISKANEGIRKASASLGKNADNPEFYYNMLREYTAEFNEKISRFEDKIKDLEDKINDLEDRIDDLED
jgi:transcriptional regulator with XRE-family HTH domain